MAPLSASAQNLKPVAEWLESYRPNADFQPVSLFQRSTDRSDLSDAVDDASVLNINPNEQKNLLQTAPPALLFSLPAADGNVIELELAQVEIVAPDFYVSTNTAERVDYHSGVHYRGIIRGNPNSIAALSVTENGVMGMLADDGGAYELGEMEDGSGRYVFYKTDHLKAMSPNNCYTDDVAVSAGNGDEPASGDRGVGCKTVQVYFECDYKLYTDKGSNTTNVSNYVTSLFNQVATLYANENIGIAISQIYVWTTNDPYSGYNNTSSVLNAFKQTRGTNFNGNLAHLLSTRSLGGGIGYVDVICTKAYAFGVSAINTSFQNVPTYSWSVEVVTHELGHNLGSWHTHSCNWPTGALDNCVSPEGSCSPGPAPTNGGTIMSYCHLTSYGINFNNGFGPTPGARVRDRVTSASCLSQSGVAPTGLATTNVTSNSATLTWAPVAGATNYTVQYKLSSSGSWIDAGTTTATTYSLNGLSASQTYNWQVKTDCSGYSATASFTTTSSGGGNCNAPSNLSTTNITSSAATLSWSAVSGATNYSVQYKLNTSSSWTAAGTFTSTSLNLGNLSASSLYNWQVKANCSAWSTTANFTTTSSGGGGCQAPGGLTTVNITSNTATLTWSAVSGASNYTVQYKLSSSGSWTTAGTTSSTSLNLSNLNAASAYNWQVKTNCSAWSASANFTTASGGGGGCEAPSTLNNNSIGSTYANISWNSVSGASYYTLQIKLTNSSNWFTLGSVNVTSVMISGLSPSTSYQWRVKTNCSDYSAVKTLITTANIAGGNTGNLSQPTIREIDEPGTLELYPNPATDQLNLRYSTDLLPDSQIVLLDATGKVAAVKSFEPTLDISTLAPGVYFVHLMDGTRRVVTEKFVKIK